MQKTGAHRIGEYGLKQGAQQGGELWGSDRYPRAEGRGTNTPSSLNASIMNRSILRPA